MRVVGSDVENDPLLFNYYDKIYKKILKEESDCT